MSRPENKTLIENGIRILTNNMPHSCSVSMGVWINAGARDESIEESGLFHFIEHMLFKGTAKRSAFQLAREFDAMGGNTNAFTSMETTCYHAKVITSHAKTAADLLTDIFLNSTFDPEEVEKERPVIIQEIGMVEDNPEDYIHLLAGQCCFKDNSLGYSILGTRENVLGFDANRIKAFFRCRYQPQRSIVSVAGNIEHNQILDIVGPALEKLERGDGFPERAVPSVHPGVNLFAKDLEQVHICVSQKGLSITDERRYAFSLMNTLLGGNMSSRLFQEIREKRGLAYSVYSFISSYADTGVTGAYVAVDPCNVVETVEIIIKEIKKLTEKLVTPVELKDAVEYTKGCLLLSSESTDSQMFRQAQNEINFGRNIPLQEVIDAVESVTPEDISVLAEALFDIRNISITILGSFNDKKKIENILTV
jgi:predicted Zn-dependent peptidase